MTESTISVDCWEELADDLPVSPVSPIALPNLTIEVPVEVPSEPKKFRVQRKKEAPIITPQASQTLTTQVSLKSPEQIEELLKLTNPGRRLTIDTANALAKVGYRRWVYIANSGVTPDEKALWTTLYEQGNSEIKQNETSILLSTGDELYLKIHQKLTDLGVQLPTIHHKEKGKKSNTKKDQIKQDNIVRRVDEELQNLINLADKNFDLSTNYKFIEMNIAKMILYLNLNQENPLDLIISFNKFISEAATLNISKLALTDLEYVVENLKKKVNFDPIKTITTEPRLIFKTKYDKICNSLKQKLFSYNDLQKQILECVKKNNNYVALVHSMLGSGKTTIVPMLAGFIKSNLNMKILYSCPNEAVVLEVSRTLYSIGIPFSIVVYDSNHNTLDFKPPTYVGKAKEQKDKVRLFLADMCVTRIMLERRKEIIDQRKYYMTSEGKIPKGYPEVPDYLLITDEPTKDADLQENLNSKVKFSLTTEIFMDILKLLPDRTILMSATLPTYTQLKPMWDRVAEGKTIYSFSSGESKVGVSLISEDGNIFLPHQSCQTVTEIKKVLETIQTNPFIGRFYTFQVLLKLVDKLEEMKLPTPDLTQFFKNPSSATQYNIQKIIYKLLDTLETDQQVQEINKIKIRSEKIRIEELFKTEMQKLSRPGQCCIYWSAQPIKDSINLYKKNFGENIFDQVKINKIIDSFLKKKKEYELNLERIEKAKDLDNKDMGQAGLVETKEARISKLQDQRPFWEFPTEYQLCSEAHLNKYGIKNQGSMGNVEYTDLPEAGTANTELLTLLASGIGVYTESLDTEYKTTVLTLAKQGKLKFIFADTSLAYGTNLAVTDIILDDNLGGLIDRCSIKTLFQICGRAGRGGMSYMANIYTLSKENNFQKKIDQYIAGTLDEGDKDEIKNITTAYQLML